MVGGRVIGLARTTEGTLVHVQDTGHGCGNDRCSIRVVEKRRDDGRPVSIGIDDSIWWQGRDALWTPAEVREKGNPPPGTYDIRIPRVGYSH